MTGVTMEEADARSPASSLIPTPPLPTPAPVMALGCYSKSYPNKVHFPIK